MLRYKTQKKSVLFPTATIDSLTPKREESAKGRYAVFAVCIITARRR